MEEALDALNRTVADLGDVAAEGAIGTASIVTRACCPSVTVGMSVSSTSTSASSCDMSAMVSS